jgi:hypothetical protein
MKRMSTARVALACVCAGALSLAACSGKNSGSTTTASPTPAAATISESFTAPLGVGGAIFYSFSMPQYGNVAITLTGIAGAALPDGLTLNVGIGRPAGTTCTTTSTIDTGPGDTAQLTGVYGPGVFCVRVVDSGTLTAPVIISAAVAHS